MSHNITLFYSLHPPESTEAPPLGTPSKTYEFPLKSGATNKQGAYYNALREAILEAKVKIGEDLTVWRDAVGTLEDKKEPRKVKTDDNGELEESDDEQP